MSEIPEDIRERARAVAEKITCPDLPYDEDVALMAERERCAKIADEYEKRDPAGDGNGYWAAQEIAAAIRNQP